MEEYDERKPFIIMAVSDRGSVRPRNEDYFGIFDPETDELAEKCGVLVVVADGMGGHLSGAEASKTVVDALAETYFHDCKEDEEAIDRLARAFREANRTVFLRVGEGRQGLAGTTCTALALFPDSVHLVHAGDSRAYRIREGTIEQLTKDHSVVGEMVRNGMLSKEEARRHPRRRDLLFLRMRPLSMAARTGAVWTQPPPRRRPRARQEPTAAMRRAVLWMPPPTPGPIQARPEWS